MAEAAAATAPTSTLERLLAGYMAVRAVRLDERLAIAQTAQPALHSAVQVPSQPNANPSPAIAEPGFTVAGVSWVWIVVALVVLLGVVVALRKG